MTQSPVLLGVSDWTRLDWAKLVACAAIDVADFTLGRALMFIPWEEFGYALAAVAMWGWRGLLVLAELGDLTEQIDAFIPVTTAVALMALRAKHARARSRKSASGTKPTPGD